MSDLPDWDLRDAFEEAKAEIDRLRAENQAHINGRLVMDTKQELVSEIDRLRAELEEAKQYVLRHREAISDGLVHLNEIERLRYEVERWKHVAENKWGIDDLQKYQDEIERLRAENADLAGMLKLYFHAHETGNSLPPYIVTQARAILAKAAKEEK